MPIEVHQTKRKIVYRAVIPDGEPGSKGVTKSFRTRAAAEAWEREMIATGEGAASAAGGDAPGARTGSSQRS
jgi:hypothetical protein